MPVPAWPEITGSVSGVYSHFPGGSNQSLTQLMPGGLYERERAHETYSTAVSGLQPVNAWLTSAGASACRVAQPEMTQKPRRQLTWRIDPSVSITSDRSVQRGCQQTLNDRNRRMQSEQIVCYRG